MKKLSTCISAVVFSLAAIAQPTLNGNEILYSAGQSYQVHFGTQSSLNVGSSGNGVTWDMSAISCPTTQTVAFLSPASCPGYSNFPSANLAMTDDAADIYSYEYTGNTSWQRVGAYQVSSSTSIPFTNTETLISFPISYGNIQTDAFSGSTTISGIPVNRGGDVTTEYDGFGTLIMPYGTVSNVVRIHTHEDYSDEYVGYGMQVDYLTDAYVFYKQGINYPIYTFTSFTSSSGSTMYSSYLDQSYVGISEQGTIEGFSLYPNPATDFVMAEFESDAADLATINITDLSGKLISSTNTTIESAGMQSIRLDVSNLESGLYIVSINIDNKTAFVKLNVQ